MVAITVATGATANADRSRLASEFSGWHIWNSAAGRWWATRRGNARLSHDHDPDWSMTVDGDTLDELRISLQSQEEMR
jgi:hypothetical protein